MKKVIFVIAILVGFQVIAQDQKRDYWSLGKTLEPHHLPHYTTELATAFHWFYENCRVISSNPEDRGVSLARLKLVESAQIVFRRSLELMGMSAPDRM